MTKTVSESILPRKLMALPLLVVFKQSLLNEPYPEHAVQKFLTFCVMMSLFSLLSSTNT